MQDVENFAKKTSWQIAKILELSALDHPSYATSIPIAFDRTISTLPVYQFIKYLDFVFTEIKPCKDGQFSCILQGISGPKGVNPGGAPYGGHIEYLTKNKVDLEYWCKDLPTHQKS